MNSSLMTRTLHYYATIIENVLPFFRIPLKAVDDLVKVQKMTGLKKLHVGAFL